MDVPVTVDFEGGYSENEDKLAENISRLLDLGVIGINFEDRVVKGEGLYKVDRQAKRIAKIRETAKKAGVDLFINARTDVFFQDGESKKSVASALESVVLPLKFGQATFCGQKEYLCPVPRFVRFGEPSGTRTVLPLKTV